MSMTKRNLESRPVEEQDAILGGPDYFQRLAAEPMPKSPVSLSPEPPKCSKCTATLDASELVTGVCAYCEASAYRRTICDRYYGSRR